MKILPQQQTVVDSVEQYAPTDLKSKLNKLAYFLHPTMQCVRLTISICIQCRPRFVVSTVFRNCFLLNDSYHLSNLQT